MTDQRRARYVECGMRPLLAVAAAAALSVASSAAFAETRDALSPWEGSHVAEGATRIAPIRLKVELARGTSGYYRRVPTSELVGTIQRCFHLGTESELCGADRPVVVRRVDGATTIFLVKTQKMVRFLSNGSTENFTTTTEERLGLAKIHGDTFSIVSEDMFAAWSEPSPSAHGNMGQSGR